MTALLLESDRVEQRIVPEMFQLLVIILLTRDPSTSPLKKAQASVGAGGTGGGSGSGPGSSSSDQTTMIVSISVGAVVLLIILGIVIGIYLYLHHVHKLEQPVSKEDDKKPCSIAKSKDEMRTK